MLKQREPEFARRRDDLGALEGITTVGGTLAAEAEEIAADGDGDGAVDGDAEALETPRAPVAAPPGATSSKRERRRQRRATRPHGRAR